MRLIFIAVLGAAALTVTSGEALADKKAVAKAIKAEYQLTKRSILTGQAKSPGTVVYVARDGLLAIKPVAAVPETVVESRAIIIPSSGSLSLPPGEGMHIYSARTTRDSLRLHLGTVRSYEAPGVLGSTVYQPYQLALRFRYPSGLNSVSTEQVLDDVRTFLSKEPIANSEQVVEAVGPEPQPLRSEPSAAPVTTAAQNNPSPRQSDGRSMEGLEPIGQITKPGCDGLEVIGYAQNEFGTGQYYYYAAFRNNTSVSKIVGVRHIGGRTVHGRNREGSGDLTVKAGDIKKYQIDLSINPPILFEVTRCL